MHNVALILLSAGESSRFIKDTKLPKKQWLRIDEMPLWLKVASQISTYYEFHEIIIVGHKDEISFMQKYVDSIELNCKLIYGGNTRQESLQNAINITKCEYVLVHDIARCNVPQTVFNRILDNMGKYDCVVPYVQVHDTMINNDEYLNRDMLKSIQTPQLSKTSILKEAVKDNIYTDESSAISKISKNIHYIKGDLQSTKITTIDDIRLLNLNKPSDKLLIGFGSDVHALKEGNRIILGGIEIPCQFNIIAHSDGDIVLHAISDAILGAIGAGDIGEWFPDNDDTYKNANSEILLQKIVDFTISVGYKIRQTDVVIFAQQPKLSTYKKAIEKNIAKILNIPITHMNVKATTTEKLGFVGRMEGILVQCNVILEYFNWQNYQ